MLRKTVLLCLLASAVGTTVVGELSRSRVFYGDARLSSRNHVYLHLDHGFIRLCWLTSPAPFRLDIDRPYRHYGFDCRCGGCRRATITHASSRELRRARLGIHELRWHWRIPQDGTTCPPVYMTLIRNRAWPVAMAFAAFPALALLVSPFRRARRNRACCSAWRIPPG